jgi:hypothetical protein
MPPRCNGNHLRKHFPAVAASMDRFIKQIHLETRGRSWVRLTSSEYL